MKLTRDTETLKSLPDVWCLNNPFNTKFKAVDILSFINYTNFRILDLRGLLNVDPHSRFLSYFQS